jgi:radical SAM superfamily enzyme YgiQ (UPF0313 family)
MGRVLLISANREHFPEPVFPLGAMYVASALIEQKMSVRIFDAGVHRFPFRALRREIVTYRPNFIGLSLRNIDNAAYPCTKYYVDGYKKIVETVRLHSHAPLFLGGPAFSIFPEELMLLLDADGGIVGDGEEGMVRLCSGERGSIVRTELPILRFVGFPPTIEAIFPAFRKYRTLGIQTARGCPHRCAYCTYPLLEGGRVRVRPPEEVADEIAFLSNGHGKRDFFIVDSTFNANELHMEEVCRAIIAKRLSIRFSCYLTPKMNDLSHFRLLSEAGCIAVDFGTDSCSEKMLRSLRKTFTPTDIRNVSGACRRAGIDFCHSLIFGGPGETQETVRETVTHMDALRPRAVLAMTGIRIYPGTELARVAEEEGVVVRGEDLLIPRFYFHGWERGLLRCIAGLAGVRKNWFLPGDRDWSSAWGPRLLRSFHRFGPLWRTFRQP